MKKWKIMRKVGIMGHYLLSYTLALLLAGLLIAAVFLIISAKQVAYLELDYWEHSLERTANELETQQELLGDIHARMMISYSFQPTALFQNHGGGWGVWRNRAFRRNYRLYHPVSNS